MHFSRYQPPSQTIETIDKSKLSATMFELLTASACSGKQFFLLHFMAFISILQA